MSMNKNLTYSKCFCCCKNYNIPKLIDINTDTVVIGDENLSFDFLLLDVCFVKIDNTKANYICEHCKDQIVQFHMFKRDILKYSDLELHITRLDLLYLTNEALNSFNKFSDLSISSTSDSIIITCINEGVGEHLIDPVIESEILHEEQDLGGQLEPVIQFKYQSIPLESHDNHQNEFSDEELENLIEELPDQNLIVEVPLEQVIQDQEDQMIEDHIDEEENLSVNEVSDAQSTKSKSLRRKKYHYKVNTNESLTPQQLDWINFELRKSEIIKNGQKAFKCKICKKILKLASIFKKHMRDFHILKTPEEREQRKQKNCFKEEIKRSRMEIQTANGIETIWKCERCNFDRIFKSEPGLKVHLRYNHIAGEIIPTDFIAKCRVKVETNKGIKNGWRCVDCQKILLSRDALRCHMKLEHKERVAELCKDQKAIDMEEDVSHSNKSLISLLETNQKHSSSNLTCCDICGLRFINGTTKRSKSLEIHQQLHTILKVINQSYDLPKCPDCKVMYSNNEELSHHLENHDRNEFYQSEGISHQVAVKFKESQSSSDNNLNSWKCGNCKEVYFNDETECIEHQMILHSKQLICPFDFLEFTGVRGLGQFYQHMKNKHSEMFPQLSIFCSYCGEEFSNVFDKLTHMKNCENKKFECDHCQRTFFKKNQLIRHLKIVSGDVSYICEVCSKKCVSTMDLKLHLRKHTNEKTYQCSFPNCMKIFKTPAARSSHMEIHSNIEYECTDCKTIFKQRALLQRHLKKNCTRKKIN